VPGASGNAALVHAAVDRVLVARGAYQPIELLIELARLDYARYEAWRCGEIETLDEALLGNRRRIARLLEEAAAWARRLSLAPARLRYEGWGPRAGQPLRASAHQALRALLETGYRRRRAAPQLDLFLDGSEVAALNAACAALVARDPAAAAARLAELRERAPSHRQLADLERLGDALEALAAGGPELPPALELAAIERQLGPAAERVLGARSRDFLAPFWRRLAERLRALPFDPRAPELHASHAYARCLDWRAARDSVLATAGFTTHPELLERLATAELRLGQRVAAIRWLAELCWRHPERADTLLCEQGFTDHGVEQAWEAFTDLDLEAPLGAAWFPAWLLIAEPGLARAWPEARADEPSGATSQGTSNAPGEAARRAFTTLARLIVAEREGAPADQVRAQRATLAELSAALLERHLEIRSQPRS